MPKKYKVIVSPQARHQIQSIRDYILFSLKSPVSANNTISALREAIFSLEQLPNRIPLTDEEKWREYGIHKMSVKNYLVYFTVNEEISTVYVFAVIYAKRDQSIIIDEIM